jgi:surfeit locus 1 family protein
MSRRTDLRFLVRPKWIAGHLLAIVAVVGFINLGSWQLRRLEERRDLNHLMTERLAEAPAPLGELLATYGEDPAAIEFRRVEAVGRYRIDDEVLWQARTLRGRSGHDVLTPLETDDRGLIIDRGWVPVDSSDPPVLGARPSSLDVIVTGVIRAGQVRGNLGPIDPDTGDLARVSRVDIAKLQRQIELELFPFYVLLEGQTPEQASGLPLLQDLPDQSEGPHLGYAIQWFVFASIAAIGYPVLLRKTARDEAAEG